MLAATTSSKAYTPFRPTEASPVGRPAVCMAYSSSVPFTHEYLGWVLPIARSARTHRAHIELGGSINPVAPRPVRVDRSGQWMGLGRRDRILRVHIDRQQPDVVAEPTTRHHESLRIERPGRNDVVCAARKLRPPYSSDPCTHKNARTTAHRTCREDVVPAGRPHQTSVAWSSVRLWTADRHVGELDLRRGARS